MLTISPSLSLFTFKNATSDLQIHVHTMYPDAMDVGSNLEESLCFLQFHQEITAKYHSKKSQIVESILKQEPNANLTYLWTEADKQVELRERLLQQAVKFHRCARSVGFFLFPQLILAFEDND